MTVPLWGLETNSRTMTPTKTMLEHSLDLLDDFHENMDNIKERMRKNPDHELCDCWGMDLELLKVQKSTLEKWIADHNFDI
jgi:hypothetical protein